MVFIFERVSGEKSGLKYAIRHANSQEKKLRKKFSNYDLTTINSS